MAGTERDPDLQTESAEEVQLLSLAKRGDMAAFRQIVILYQRQVLRTSHRLLGSLELAEDAVQETFLRVIGFKGVDGNQVASCSVIVGEDFEPKMDSALNELR